MPDDKLRILISSIKEVYSEEAKREASTSFLIWGSNRSGKTHSLTTARRPIGIDSFDPGGLDLPIIQRGIAEGWILAEPFEDGTPRRIVPRTPASDVENAVYTRFAKRFLQKLESGFFNLLGTYVIDSGTDLATAMLSQAAAQFSRKEGAPTRHEYKFAKKRLYDLVHTVVSELPCDFIMTAHIYSFTDDTTGKVYNEISLPQGPRRDTTNAMHEIYLARSERTSGDQAYHWQTVPDKDYTDVGSRLSDGRLARKELQDFKAILKKLGRRHEDAPPIAM